MKLPSFSLVVGLALFSCAPATPPAEPPAASHASRSELTQTVSKELDAALQDKEQGMDDRAAVRLRRLIEAGPGLLTAARERGQAQEIEDVSVLLARACTALGGIYATLGMRAERLDTLFAGRAFAHGTRVQGTLDAIYLTELAAGYLSTEDDHRFVVAAALLNEAQASTPKIKELEDALSIKSQILNLRVRSLLTFIGLGVPALRGKGVADLPPSVQRYLLVVLNRAAPPREGEALDTPVAADQVAWLEAQQPIERALLKEALALNAATVAIDRQRFEGAKDGDALRAMEVAKDIAQEAEVHEALLDFKTALARRITALETFDQLNLFEDAVIERDAVVRLSQKVGDVAFALRVSTELVLQVEAKTGSLSGRSLPRFLGQFEPAYVRHFRFLLQGRQAATNETTKNALNEQLVLHADRSNFRATRRDFTLYRSLGERIANDAAFKARLERQRSKIAELQRLRDDAVAEGRGPDDPAYHPAPGLTIDEPFSGLRTAHDELVAILEDVKRGLLDKSTAHSGLVGSLAEVREGMTANDAVVFYFRGGPLDENLHAAVIANSTLRVLDLPKSQAVLAQLVTDARESVALGDASPAAFRELSKEIWLPLGSLPKNVTIVPNAELAGVPFEALPAANGRPAVLSHSMRYAFGLSKGMAVTGPARPISKALVAGAEEFGAHHLEALRSSRLEVETVRTVLGSAGAKVAPIEALPRRGLALFSEQAHYDFMLLSTHSVVESDVPMADVLAFPQDDVDAWSIATSPVRSELLILSACELMRSRSGAEDPVSGIATAALARVAPRLVSALWNVDEEASRLFVGRFTARLAAGEDPSAALAGVKREFINGTIATPRSVTSAGIDFKAPYYWAPFVLTLGAGG